MNIFPLIDGHFNVDKEKNFSLLNEENEGLKMAVQPFLIQIDNENILLDAGLGWLENNEPKIIQNLEHLNLNPSTISKILLSHLHKDHVDGLVKKVNGNMELIFPNASLYIQKREYEFAITQTESLSYDLSVLDFIIKNSEIIWLNDDKGNITDKIRFEVTGGHTPFLQVFWIEEQNEIAFFGSDNLPLRAYLKHRIAYKSDFDGKKAMQDRLNWEELAIENHWKVLFYHDLKNPTFQF
ncbi:Glyoxylase, beta-lactamase superfamily II [Chishuiella changwenlii]|uniref:Glyoxylase, beta-lactamase superfamily II n=1 Tax=Chishuiella changwenlii TaxID=1434701 RepID=A0A1M7BNU9_9FLAO|nr:MBL fold metallo-hydrolase [Chishuiella changwenlii]GGF03086.1 hypothetical protein GCM10010984_20680 [Chishuiella changwenlii]SHL56664.1 Glyoxylase, beta-lactamase superfamily II [Chishuiella changwenlii]